MKIPVLSGIVEGLKVFFRTKRYVAYTTVFAATTFLAIFVSGLMTRFAGTFIEVILVNFFAYVGAAGTIYFMIGSLLTGLKLDKLWIKRRGRGRWNELMGLTWMVVSFAAAVFLSILFGPAPLIFFAMVCWVGWIAFQAYLSSRTSLRIATIAEPKKGGIAIGLGSFLILIIGIGIIAAEIISALIIFPNNLFGVGDFLSGLSVNWMDNLATHLPFITIAMGLLGAFALISFFAFLRYSGRGAALNISLLTIFIGIYSWYFLINIIRRSQPFGFDPTDVVMTLFFLVYAMSGIGRTIIEEVEESRSRLVDFGPLLTFFLASGYVFVDSIIAASTGGSTLIAGWFQTDLIADTYAAYLFRDVSKLVAFPLVAIFSSLYYLLFQRKERIIEKAEMEGDEIDPGEADEDIVEAAKEAEEEEGRAIPKGKPGRDLTRSDPDRLRVDDSRRLGSSRRYGDDDEE
ncbi:MAG: conserved membrane protein of unknown function [Candidatus Thorarchaeota archaeon]|nr:MAG: conserved membrane protein of unknown function [Candidatus Thorarchaeota archaeon]